MTVIAHVLKQRVTPGAPPANRHALPGAWWREPRLPGGSRLQCFLHLV